MYQKWGVVADVGAEFGTVWGAEADHVGRTQPVKAGEMRRQKAKGKPL